MSWFKKRKARKNSRERQRKVQEILAPEAKRLSKDMMKAQEIWDNIASSDMDDSMLENPKFSSALDSLEHNIHGMNSEIQELLRAMRDAK